MVILVVEKRCSFILVVAKCISMRQLIRVYMYMYISANAYIHVHTCMYVCIMCSLFVPLKHATSSFIDLVNTRNLSGAFENCILGMHCV